MSYNHIAIVLIKNMHAIVKQDPRIYFRADSRFVPNQWETSLQNNAISHWLGANLESAMYLNVTSAWLSSVLMARNATGYCYFSFSVVIFQI